MTIQLAANTFRLQKGQDGALRSDAPFGEQGGGGAYTATHYVAPYASVSGMRLAELTADASAQEVRRLIEQDYLRPDNDALPRSGPPGVRIVTPRWRNTA